MNITINKLNNKEFYSLCKRIPALLKETADYYPYFDAWLANKVLPGIDSGLRHVYVAYDENRPVGLTICKTENLESKLCTLWVDREYQKNHIGTDLLQASLKVFKTSPIITIPEFKIQEFKPLIDKRSFFKIEKATNLYQKGVNEFIFNIPLLTDNNYSKRNYNFSNITIHTCKNNYPKNAYSFVYAQKTPKGMYF